MTMSVTLTKTVRPTVSMVKEPTIYEQCLTPLQLGRLPEIRMTMAYPSNSLMGRVNLSAELRGARGRHRGMVVRGRLLDGQEALVQN